MDALTSILYQFSFEPNSDSQRIFHGRGHTYPGLEWLTVDWFSPVVMATLFKEPEEVSYKQLKGILQTLMENPAITTVYLQHRYHRDAEDEWLGEPLTEALYAQRKQLLFELNLGSRQNTGYFLDMEPGRQWLENQSQGSRGVNLFAYTCALSAVAIAAGAKEVFNVDMSKNALVTGQRNHQKNDLRGGRFIRQDVFKCWKKLAKDGPFDWIVVDPPSHQPGSFVAKKDYAKLIRHLAKITSPGTEILACLNSPQLDSQFLIDTFTDNLPQAKFIERLAGSADFPEAEPEKSLKCLVFKTR